MRPPTDLLDLPFTFTQFPLLTPREFIARARDRGVYLSYAQLEAMHQLRLLTPLLRLRRDGRLIAALARAENPVARQVAHWESSSRLDLLEARSAGRLFDPATEGFVSRRRWERNVGNLEYHASELFYSHHQLLQLRTLEQTLPYLRIDHRPRGRRPRLEVHRFFAAHCRAEDQEYRSLAVVLSALEPRYYPQIIERLSLGHHQEFRDYDRWREREKLTFLLGWLSLKPDWLKAAGANLLGRADSVDPLGEWLSIVREADPDKWLLLRGNARKAIDFRIAAEMLLRYYDHLAAGRRVKPIKEPSTPWYRGDFDNRLKRRGGLDRTLTEFGLSPHPSLVLVLEGATEMAIFPRVMQHFGVRRDDDFISIHDAHGVDTDLAPLVSYAIAPRTELEQRGDYLGLHRPICKLLVVIDAENSMATRELREKKRAAWVERLVLTLPAPSRTRSVQAALDRLVFVQTWNRRGESFEFAHFTDRQLAAAIQRIDRRPRAPSITDRLVQIERLRERHGNLEPNMGRASKTELADELWPVLEQRLERAVRNKTERRVPIVRVLDRAIELAREVPRRGVVLPL